MSSVVMKNGKYWFFGTEAISFEKEKNTIVLRSPNKVKNEFPDWTGYTEYLIPKYEEIDIDTQGALLFIPIEGKIVLSGIQQPEIELTPGAVFLHGAKSDKIKMRTLNDHLWSRLYIIELPKSLTEEGNFLFNELKMDENLTVYNLSESHSIYMGLYGNRITKQYIPKHRNSLVTVINGVFEFQDRLINTRELLLVKDEEDMEFESLTENGVILIFNY